jgi:hypothetical protein
MGDTLGDAELLARLVALVSPALTAPLGTPQQIATIERLLQLTQRALPSGRTARPTRATAPKETSTEADRRC